MCAYLSKLHEHVQSCFCASVSFTSSAFDDAAMAPKSSKRYARNSQPFKAGIDGRQKRIHAPDPSARWPKFALSPYATEGCPFYTKGEDESKVLRPAAIAATRSPGNSEWCARPGFALSESAANVEMGTEVLQTYFASAACFAEHFDGLGFKGMASALETAEGKAFMAACNRLNKRNQAEHTSESLDHDVKAWHDFLSDNSEAKARMARKLAMVSGRFLERSGLRALCVCQGHEDFGRGPAAHGRGRLVQRSGRDQEASQNAGGHVQGPGGAKDQRQEKEDLGRREQPFEGRQ